MKLRSTATAWVASCALLAACTTETHSPVRPVPEVAGTQTSSALGEVTGPVVVAVGDLACPPGAATTPSRCRQAATAALAKGYEPRVVLALGDQQYDSGRLSDFQGSYDAGWGSLRSVTRPVPGNHEYRTRGASGYYDYFAGQQPGPPGYYAFNVGSWRVYALNTNCGAVDCARERRWMARDMSRYPRRCSMMTMHHPRYSSGEHGSQSFVRPFWRVALRHHTDLALAGHDHDYERFRKMDAAGAGSRAGIASFVSGAGGKELYRFESRAPGSAFRHNSTFGVLALSLGRGAYAWEYRAVDGPVVDSGTGRCV